MSKKDDALKSNAKTRKDQALVSPTYLRDRHERAHVFLGDAFYSELASWRVKYHEEGEKIMRYLEEND